MVVTQLCSLIPVKPNSINLYCTKRTMSKLLMLSLEFVLATLLTGGNVDIPVTLTGGLGVVAEFLTGGTTSGANKTIRNTE